jgi:hypothetical protein
VVGLASLGAIAPAALAQNTPVCENGQPIGPAIKGDAKLGDYAGVPLPPSFKTAQNETHVDAMIMVLYITKRTTDYACFAKGFPAATALFERHMRH